MVVVTGRNAKIIPVKTGMISIGLAYKPQVISSVRPLFFHERKAPRPAPTSPPPRLHCPRSQPLMHVPAPSKVPRCFEAPLRPPRQVSAPDSIFNFSISFVCTGPPFLPPPPPPCCPAPAAPRLAFPALLTTQAAARLTHQLGLVSISHPLSLLPFFFPRLSLQPSHTPVHRPAAKAVLPSSQLLSCLSLVFFNTTRHKMVWLHCVYARPPAHSPSSGSIVDSCPSCPPPHDLALAGAQPSTSTSPSRSP